MWCSMSSARPLVRCQCPDANRRRTARETVARWSPSVVRRCRYAMSETDIVVDRGHVAPSGNRHEVLLLRAAGLPCKLVGYLLGSYRIATTPEPSCSRLTSFRSTRFDSPANNV